MDGVIVVDKGVGGTSHDVVNALRRLAGTKRVGHTGTLDPMATGVLVACVGQATRIAEYLTADTKVYEAGVSFGWRTDTQDATGACVSETDASGLTAGMVEAVLDRFRGNIEQVPPMVSAVHHNGRRLYELARKGQEVERKPRRVRISDLRMLDFVQGAHAHARLVVECSGGTYIRTLASDIGDAVGVGAVMDSLRRTRSGAFTIDEALALADLRALAEQGRLAEAVHPVADCLQGFARLCLDAAGLEDVSHGRRVHPEVSAPEGALVVLTDGDGQAVAIGRSCGAEIAPVKVLIGV